MGDHSSKTKPMLWWPFVVASAFMIVAVGAWLTESTAGTVAPRLSGPESGSISTAASTTTTTTTTTTTATTATATTTTTYPSVPMTVGTSEPYGVPVMTEPTELAPRPLIVPGFIGRGLITIARGGAPLSQLLGDEPFVFAREGLVFPAAGYSIDRQYIWIFTSCDAYAWVPADQVLAEPPERKAPGLLSTLADATIVLDPGHGGPFNIGAVGNGSLQEKDVNLLIAQRVRDLLSEPRSVDWGSGAISSGSGVAAAGWVIMTRVGGGGDADYEAGLKYRSAIANAVDADAMVSIHNNAGIRTSLDEPGSDVYYQSQLQESRRFAEIMVEELERSFSSFSASWVGASNHGAVSRISARDRTSQYYGVLRRTEVPTVLIEGVYISNPSEAELLKTPAFQQAYADAVYRGLVRFLTTQDAPEVATFDPVVWRGVAGSGDARDECKIPVQP